MFALRVCSLKTLWTIFGFALVYLRQCLNRSGWPWIYYPPASDYQITGLQACTIICLKILNQFWTKDPAFSFYDSSGRHAQRAGWEECHESVLCRGTLPHLSLPMLVVLYLSRSVPTFAWTLLMVILCLGKEGHAWQRSSCLQQREQRCRDSTLWQCGTHHATASTPSQWQNG